MSDRGGVQGVRAHSGPRQRRGARSARAGRVVALLAALLLLGGAHAQPRAELSFGPWSQAEPHRAALRDDADVPEVPLDAEALRRYDRYRLAWRVLPGRGALAGRQALHFRNRGAEPMSNLELQLLPELLGATFVIEGAQVDGRAVAVERDERWRARLPLPEPLAPGEAAVASLRYRLELPEGDTPGYGLTARRGGLWSLGHAYALRQPQGRSPVRPTLQGDVAVADAALYRVRLRLPAGWSVAVSGTVVVDEQVDELAEDEVGVLPDEEPDLRTDGPGNGGRIVEVATGPARDLYAVLGEDAVLARFELPTRGPTVVGHARAEEEAGVREAMAHAVVALSELEELYGPYPYRELEVAPLDTPALGVEFPGLILVSGSALRQRAPLTLASTVVHEVAHQWFYNLVGSDQVLEPWLDESLAQYVTLRVLEERYPASLADAFRNDLAQWWGRAGLRRTRIDRPVSAYGDDGGYGAIVYGRGPLLLDALAERIGTQRLDALLRSYVAEHRFRRVDGSVLMERLQRACACRLHQLEPDLR